MEEQKMLINALHAEDIRIAIIQGKELVELEIDSSLSTGQKLKGNIYKTKVTRIEPSLQAAFIDIGTKRNGFLQINDIHPSYFRNSKYIGKRFEKIPIQEVLEPGQDIIVQVVKEERGLKGATLTTYISLPGRYVVFMPGTDSSGISKKIKSAEQRSRLAKLHREVEMPSGAGIIVRTAGLDRSQTDLTRDMEFQLKLWEQIVAKAQNSDGNMNLIYQESDPAVRVVRDYFSPEIREILIDDDATYERVKDFVGQVMPRYRSRVKKYSSHQPIFSNFNIDSQVEETFRSEVHLPSGGAIVIDTLEALVAIDVNSGKDTSGEGIEQTALRTNLEAADEIAKQLRLRDLGGLIVIDFIDMLNQRNRAAVEKRMHDAVKIDKARIELSQLSQFGLLEMSRQRLKASIISKSSIKCPSCHGTGNVKSPELVALETLRKIQSAVVVGKIRTVNVRMSPSPALFLLNNKKDELVRLESEHDARILVLADGRLTPDEVEFEMGPPQNEAPKDSSAE